MERTISITKGEGSVNHNTRKFTAKNIDPDRTQYNIQFCNQDIREAYHYLFDDAVERYNTKQKRADRKIDNYYEKIRVGKQEKLFHEVVVQIGNRDDMSATSENGQFAKEMLVEYMEGFQERNPNLYVFSAHLHMDEDTPHLHIDYIPFTTGSKRGLDIRVSQKKALEAQGFVGGSGKDNEATQWVNSEKEVLAEIMERRDVKWLKKGTHEKHLSVLDFKKKERAKEVAALEVQIASSNELLKATDNLISERTEIAEKLESENAELSSENESLEEKQESLQKEIEGLTGSKKKLERNVRAYDEDPKWQLPEPSLMQSAKSYKDKEASPLVSMLKDLVKNLTIQCVQLMEQVKKLTKRVEKQDADIQSYKNKVKVQGDRIEELEVDSADLKLLKRYLGEEKSRTILESVKEKKCAQKVVMQSKKVSREDMGR